MSESVTIHVAGGPRPLFKLEGALSTAAASVLAVMAPSICDAGVVPLPATVVSCLLESPVVALFVPELLTPPCVTGVPPTPAGSGVVLLTSGAVEDEVSTLPAASVPELPVVVSIVVVV